MFGETTPTELFLHSVQETVETLKETLRELQVEFEVQKESKKDLEDCKDSLSKELTFLR